LFVVVVVVVVVVVLHIFNRPHSKVKITTKINFLKYILACVKAAICGAGNIPCKIYNTDTELRLSGNTANSTTVVWSCEAVEGCCCQD